MKASKFAEEQIAFILKQTEDGATIAEVCCKAGLSAGLRLRLRPARRGHRRCGLWRSRKEGNRRKSTTPVLFRSGGPCGIAMRTMSTL